jgi:hypothetical protein
MREPWFLILGALVACGGTQHEASGERSGSDSALEPGAGAAGPSGVGAPAAMPAAVSSLSSESSQGSIAPDLDDETSPENARSFVDLWKLGARSMSTRFVHYYQPPRGDVPAMISLMYQARDRAGNQVGLEWPYEGREASYSYANLTVAPSYVYFRNDAAQREWRVVAGDVALLPQPEGRASVELRGLSVVEGFGVEESPPEEIPDGYVTGDVERICIKYVIVEGAPLNAGRPEPQPERDNDWSSEFCSQFAP